MMYHAYHEWFRSHGLRFSPDVEAATSGQILPIVENDLGIGFVPERFLLQEKHSNLFKIVLEHPIPSCPLCFLKQPAVPLSTAAKKLEEMILARI